MHAYVVAAALRSQNGASSRLLSMVDWGKFELAVSVPLVREYEAAGKKHFRAAGLSASDVDAGIDYVCHSAGHHRIYDLWRPFLPDTKDDMVVELAVFANASDIVTHNGADFKGTEKSGLRASGRVTLSARVGEYHECA